MNTIALRLPLTLGSPDWAAMVVADRLSRHKSLIFLPLSSSSEPDCRRKATQKPLKRQKLTPPSPRYSKK